LHQQKEIERLKNELNQIGSKVGEKNAQIKHVNERASRLEQLIREKDDQLTKTNQELIVNENVLF
jgi:hypothetical protein